MKAWRFTTIAVALVAGVSVLAACTAAPASKKTNDVSSRDNDDDDDDDDNNNTSTMQTPAPTTPAPTATVPPPVGSNLPPVQTTYCRDLPACCNTLGNIYEKLACNGIALAKNEKACLGYGLVCNGFGGVLGTDCGNLNKCCTEINGSDTNEAKTCRDKVAQQNGPACKAQLENYRSDFWCE